jgi:hypothetical protein
VAERTLRNKIPETLNSGCLCARSGDPRRAAFLGAQHGDRGWSFPPCSVRDPSLLLYGSTINKPKTSSVGVGLSIRSIEPHALQAVLPVPVMAVSVQYGVYDYRITL